MSAGAFRALYAVLAVCTFNLLSTSIFAQDMDPEIPEIDPIIATEQSLLLGEGGTGAGQPVPATSAFGIIRVIFTLAVVAAAIYGFVFFIKKASRGGKTQDPFLKVLASTPLGTNRSAHIISAGSQAWLVGAAENGVHLISEITDKEFLDILLFEDSRNAPTDATPDDDDAPNGDTPIGTARVTRAPSRFSDFLRRLGMSAETGVPGPESIRQRREKLKGL